MYQQLYFILQHFVSWFCLLVIIYFALHHLTYRTLNRCKENITDKTNKTNKYAKKYSPDDFFFICINEWEDKKSKAILQKNIITNFLKQLQLQPTTLLDITQNNNCILCEFAKTPTVAKIIHQLLSPNTKPIYLQHNIKTTTELSMGNILTCLDYQYYLTEPIQFQNIANKCDVLCLQLMENGLCLKPLQKKTQNEFMDYVAKKSILIGHKTLVYSFFPKLVSDSMQKKEYEFPIYICDETMEMTIDRMQKIGWVLRDEFILPYEDDVGRSFLCFFVRDGF